MPRAELSEHTTLPAAPKLAPLFRMQYETAQEAWVLLYPEGMVQLNQSAAEILLHCDGQHTVAQIVQDIQAKFSTQGIEPEIVNLLQEAQRRAWIV